jgi:hypothetical protein
LCERAKAQTFSVGDTSFNYVVLHHQVNPFSNIPSGQGAFTLTTNYTIDVDGDFTDDIKFNWDVNGVNGGSGTYHTCNLKLSSTSNYEFVYLTTPSNCNSLPVENLANFSGLNSSLNWSLISVNNLIYTYCLRGANGCAGVGCGYFVPFAPTNLRIGFRKILTNDTIYGWLYLKTANQLDEIVSYGFKHTLTTNSIQQIKEQNKYLQIFPNPNAGEFEIKGIKEETIFISNELGQLIKAANLSAENNFSFKVNGLNSGVYFVGNKFVKQKIVVIK